MWYVAVTETNKLIICGSFAECYTRQKGYLPSAMKIALGKEGHVAKICAFWD